jgi:hypothetical protein
MPRAMLYATSVRSYVLRYAILKYAIIVYVRHHSDDGSRSGDQRDALNFTVVLKNTYGSINLVTLLQLIVQKCKYQYSFVPGYYESGLRTTRGTVFVCEKIIKGS